TGLEFIQLVEVNAIWEALPSCLLVGMLQMMEYWIAKALFHHLSSAAAATGYYGQVDCSKYLLAGAG
ncbi:MAG: hypothetical protein ACLFVT_07940, partial [Syntrophobacteria bacterium]